MDTEKFSVMFYEVGKDPELQEWPDGNIETMEACVGGRIVIDPHPIEGLVIVTRRMSDPFQDSPNRDFFLRGRRRAVIIGDFFICRQSDDVLISLTDQDVRLLDTESKNPELVKALSGLVKIT